MPLNTIWGIPPLSLTKLSFLRADDKELIDLFGSLVSLCNNAEYTLSGGRVHEAVAANAVKGINVGVLHQLIKQDRWAFQNL